MGSVNIYDAKTQFSKLVKRVRAGEVIIIADAGVPVAKLVPFEETKRPRILGGYEGKVWMADDLFAPMTPEELAAWYDGPIFPERPLQHTRVGAPGKATSPAKRMVKVKKVKKVKAARAKR